jgi:diguanylate cyclase (GGDEF)-like protein/PAS domain S-box-containing protein
MSQRKKVVGLQMDKTSKLINKSTQKKKEAEPWKEARQAQRLSREAAERLAEEMAVIAEIGRLIGSTLDIDKVYERFAFDARKLIPFDRLVVNLNDSNGSAGTVAYVSGMDIPGRRPGDSFPLRGSLHAFLEGTKAGVLFHPAAIEEVETHFPSLASAFGVGIRSFMAVPLISQEKLIGVLHFWMMRPDAYSDGELALAQRIGDQIAGAIANAQLLAGLKKIEGSLRESEGRFRAMVEQAAVGVAEIEVATGRFLTVNRRLCEMVGRTGEELRSATFLSITHPEDLRLHEDKAEQLQAGKIEFYSLEKRYLRKDGGIVWVNITVSPLWKPGERPGSTMIVVEDISARRLVEDEIKRRSRQLSVLYETSVEVMAELDLGALLQFITRRALDLVGGTSCNCYLYRPESNLMERVASAGPMLTSGNTARRRGEGFIGHIWETGVPMLINDYRSWTGRNKKNDFLPSRALVGAPIFWGKELLGIIDTMAYLPHQYTETDLDLLRMFGAQVALAIRNARLYKKIEQVSMTDELTGLFNRRGFFQLGEREFERALRFGRPLAALMIDIDHFKRVNDTHGHPAGDQVLRALADEMRRNTRGIDVVGRYGGEEFTLLLPETESPAAVQIAERLRHSVAGMLIPLRCGNSKTPAVSVRIQVSIGVASLQPGMQDLSALIDRADQALYRAKDSGRNRVFVS